MMLELFPDCAFSATVKGWEEWDPILNKGKDVVFGAISVAQLKAVIRFETNPVQSDGSRLNSCAIVEGGELVDLKNNNFKTVQALLTAVRS